jgi:hypothetical protein
MKSFRMATVEELLEVLVNAGVACLGCPCDDVEVLAWLVVWGVEALEALKVDGVFEPAAGVETPLAFVVAS